MADQVILVGLDELLDTRMGTLLKLKDDIDSSHLFGDNDYWGRASDNFSYWVDNTQYEQAYLTRDTATLKNSIITQVPFFLNTLTRSLQMHKEDAAFPVNEIIVRVNTHPYILDEFEKSELENALRQHLAYTTKIEFIHLDYKKITPQYLDSEIDAFIIYDYALWFKWHCTALQLKPIPLVTVYTPARLADNNRIVTEELKKQAHPSLVEMALVDYIILEYKDISLFSAFN